MFGGWDIFLWAGKMPRPPSADLLMAWNALLLSPLHSLRDSRARSVWGNVALAPCVRQSKCLARSWRGLA